MAILIGLGLAILVSLFARTTGFDRDRAFYPTVLLVIASYYLLFATIAGNQDELVGQLVIYGLFATLAVVGFRTNLWFVAAGLALHGVFDFGYHMVGGGSAPSWWPSFCGAYDVAAGGALAILLGLKDGPAAAATGRGAAAALE